MKKLLGFVAGLALLVVACSKDDDKPQTVDCSSVNTSFSASVFPLMQTNCAKSDCHNAGSSNGPGPLTDYAKIFAHRVAIRQAVASGQMPRDRTFSAQEKAIITCWIDAGAPNN
jgi:hypothetical protein